jgi:hypothetical protein
LYNSKIQIAFTPIPINHHVFPAVALLRSQNSENKTLDEKYQTQERIDTETPKIMDSKYQLQ